MDDCTTEEYDSFSEPHRCSLFVSSTTSESELEMKLNKEGDLNLELGLLYSDRII